MAELTTLARPYAKAAFEFALEAKDLQGWSKALSIVSCVSMAEKIKRNLDSPGLTYQQKAAMMTDVCGDELNTQQQNFVEILAENKRLELLINIKKLFELFKASYEKAIDVDLQTAFAMSDSQLASLVTTLEKKLSRKVEIKTSVNNTLIGGVLVRAGDTVIDASVKGRLGKLAEAIGA